MTEEGKKHLKKMFTFKTGVIAQSVLLHHTEAEYLSSILSKEPQELGAEAYHQSKLDAVTEEVIKSVLTKEHFHYEKGRQYKIRLGAISGAKAIIEHLKSNNK